MRPRPVLKWHRPAAHVPVTMTQIPSGTKPGKPGVFFSAAHTAVIPRFYYTPRALPLMSFSGVGNWILEIYKKD